MSQSGLDGWIAERRDLALDVIRIYLGAGLFVLGVRFALHPEVFQVWLYDAVGMPRFVVGQAIGHYVALAHLAGGLALAFGFFTRLAALVQLPGLVGAVFLVHLPGGLFAPDPSLEFSALVLFLLLVVTAFGPGRWSVDHYLATHADPSADRDPTDILLEHAAKHHHHA